MQYMYENEQLYMAILSLVTNPSGIKERLIAAGVYRLVHIKPENLPEDIQDDFREIYEKLTTVEPSGSEGSIAASVNAMDDSEASKIAENIFDIFLKLQEKK